MMVMSTMKRTKRNFAIFAILTGVVLLLSHILLTFPLSAKIKKGISSRQFGKLINATMKSTNERLKSPLTNKTKTATKINVDNITLEALNIQMQKIMANNTKQQKSSNANNSITSQKITALMNTASKLKTVVFHELKKLAFRIDNRFKSLSGHGIETYLGDDHFSNNLGSENQANVTSRPESCTACTSINFSYLINNKRLCKTPLKLITFIFSSPSAFYKRQAIRESWGTICGNLSLNIKCVFVLGNTNNKNITSSIQAESKINEDILQVDFYDAYSNLTYKTLSCLKWFSEFCSSTKYLMKTDDDVFVNLELISNMLPAAPSKKFLGGFCWGISEPHRELESKWFVSQHAYAGSRFPPMCSGTGYLMSEDAAKDFLSISRNIPFFYLEDVYIALCAMRIGIKPVNIFGFHNGPVQFEQCDYKNSVMTSHQVDPIQMKEFWVKSRQCILKRTKSNDLYKPIPYPLTL